MIGVASFISLHTIFEEEGRLSWAESLARYFRIAACLALNIMAITFVWFVKLPKARLALSVVYICVTFLLLTIAEISNAWRPRILPVIMFYSYVASIYMLGEAMYTKFDLTGICNLNTAEENDWGFAQSVAMLLLLNPLLSFVDGCAGKTDNGYCLQRYSW